MITQNTVQLVVKNGFETVEIVLAPNAEAAHTQASELSIKHVDCRVVMQSCTTGMAFGFYKNGGLR